MLAACGGSAAKADAQTQEQAETKVVTMTDAQVMGLAGKVKYVDAPIYIFGMSRIGFDAGGNISDIAWAIEHGVAMNVKKDAKGRLASFDQVVDECDEEYTYTTSITRDSADRIAKIHYQDVDYIFAYGDDGRLVKVTYKPDSEFNDPMEYAMEYDPQGREVKVSRIYPGNHVDTHRFEYTKTDANGNWTARIERLHQNGEDWEPRTEERTVIYY